MNDHLEPEILIALAEGNLDGPAADRARDHVRNCAECRGHLGDVKAIDDLVGRVAPRDEEASGDLSASLNRALDDVIRRHVGQSGEAAAERVNAADVRSDSALHGPRRVAKALPAGRASLLRHVSGVAAAAAAVLVIWMSFRPDGAPLVSGRFVREAVPGVVRATGEATIHFELSVRRPSFLAIFEVVESKVLLRYPDPNPAFGTFGRTTPFAAGEAIRIPPSPLADLDAPPAECPPSYVVVPSSESFSPSALLALETSLAASLREQGLEGFAASLASRHPDAILLR